MKAQAQLVPKHYSIGITADADDVLALILDLRAFVHDFDSSEQTEGLLATLEKVYHGDLPGGDPEDDAEEISAPDHA
jgi:hypothetical protein